MPSNIKLKLQVVDRVGAMAQIATILADHDLNILFMEVEKRGSETFVYLDLETGAKSLDQQTIFSALEAIPNILSAAAIRTMPQ